MSNRAAFLASANAEVERTKARRRSYTRRLHEYLTYCARCTRDARVVPALVVCPDCRIALCYRCARNNRCPDCGRQW